MDLFPKILNSPAALAKHFGKSTRTIRRWLKAGLPKLSDGRFDVGQVLAWFDSRQGLKAGDPRVLNLGGWVAGEDGKDHWDREGKKFQAKTREQEYRRRKGELVELSEVEALFVARVLAVKSGLLALSRSLPPQLALCKSEREMEPVIAKAVKELLAAYARPLPEKFTGPPAADSGEPTP